MESFLPDSVRALLLGLLAIGFVLSRLARAFPQVGWLRFFRLPIKQMSEEQKARRQRSANRLAGLEIVLAGVILPLLYFGSTMLLFSEPKRIPLIIVIVCSILCIVIGIWIFMRNLRP